MSQWFTVREVAKLKGVDRSTVRRWCERGYVKGAYQTPGGHWRIPAAWLEDAPKQTLATLDTGAPPPPSRY